MPTVMHDTPPFRRLRVFAFDPAASMDLRTAVVNEAVIELPWESLEPGPVGEYIEVVDVDPASGGYYAPVDLDAPSLLVQGGLPPSEGNPKFHQQMVYAVAMNTIRHFEKALGRPVLWNHHEQGSGTDRHAVFVPRLRIYPHALREANAYYSPNKVALLFGYFRAPRHAAGSMPGGLVFTCLSQDIIVHETTHAVLDGMHRGLIRPSNPDVLAFHEAFSDIVALFQRFTLTDVLRQQIGQSRGDLSRRTLLSGLATQFGHAIGHRGALREAIDEVDSETELPDPTTFAKTMEPHARGAILVAAVFDAFLSIYRTRVADLIRMATGDGSRFPDRDLHPDLVNRLADEAGKIARHILTMCIRALDYVPPVDITFGEFLRALITADHDLVPEDRRGYRIALVEAFRRRGIYPTDCRSLSIDNLLWEEPEKPLDISWVPDNLRGSRKSSRAEIWQNERTNMKELADWLATDPAGGDIIDAAGLVLDWNKLRTVRRSRANGNARIFVTSVRVSIRIGPDGQMIRQAIIGLEQERRCFAEPAHQREADSSEAGRARGARSAFQFYGGATLVVDLDSGRVKYCIRKNIRSNERLERERRFRLEPDAVSQSATYFRDLPSGEPFAFMHRHL